MLRCGIVLLPWREKMQNLRLSLRPGPRFCVRSLQGRGTCPPRHQILSLSAEHALRASAMTDPETDQTFVILLGGTLDATPRVKAAIAGARIIAADGGMRHATLLGVTPEVWVGDFDSSSAGLIANWPNVPREPYPAAKNETDGALAVGTARGRGA